MAQKSYVICPKSNSCQVMEPGFKLEQFGLRVHAFSLYRSKSSTRSVFNFLNLSPAQEIYFTTHDTYKYTTNKIPWNNTYPKFL